MVRADPDVIMVGEIRDLETAQIAIESALTGHLVLSTLHTNDAPMAAARLIEMGIEPFLVASGPRVRRRPATRAAALRLQGAGRAQQAGAPVERVRPEGRAAAGLRARQVRALRRHRLSSGRIGVYQVMHVTDPVRSLILEKGAPEAITDVARKEGMGTLRDDGFAKVREGVTSVAEVLRVAGSV